MMTPIDASGRVANATIASPVASVVGASISPLVLRVQYGANQDSTLVLPSAGEIIAANRRGLINNIDARRYGAMNGVALNAPAVNLASPDADIENFYRSELWKQTSLLQQPIPDPYMLATLRRRRLLGQQPYERMMRRADAPRDYWEAIAEANDQHPTLGMIIDAYHRKGILPGVYENWLTRLGYVNPLAQQVIEAIRRPIPPPSDLITFSVREVWDQQVVNRFGYDEEFPFAFEYWMEKLGYKWSEDMQETVGNVIPGVEWPKAYWRSHWHPLAPTQGYVAYHRLRDGRWQRYAAEVPGLTAFTWADLNTTLKVADYPPAVRKWLAASAFTPLRLVDIRNMVILRLRDRDWAVEQFRDRGLAIPDAEESADLVIRQRREKERAPIRRIEQQAVAENTRQVIEAYSLGVIDNQIALANLRTAGMRESAAQLVLNNADYRQNITHVKEAILDVRKSYFAGAFTPEGVRIALKQIGIRNDAVERYLSRWYLRRTHRRRMISTAQIVRWVKAGMMDQPTAYSQLGNLGWDQPSTLLIIAEGLAGLRKLQAAGVEAAERQRLSRVKQLQALVEKGQRQVRQFQADLRRETSLTTLSKWVKAGRISHALFLRRMIAMGYTPGVANAYLKDAVGSAGEATGVEAPAPPQGQGQGQPTPPPGG